ncbi:MAG TPA: sulfite exporter TauE/SafE family protein [Polyangiaceae bacterium]|nr:sulfite exporter TauE/SafE family protein [Polyangiaceae bacterium]
MASLDPLVSLAGFGVGLIVGLTGMGGGALMTPILVLLFGVAPTAAVASDLAASLVMKPLGALIHFRRGTVHRPMVQYLLIGSVPSAFAGAALINHLGRSGNVNSAIKLLLGVALLVASGAQLAKTVLRNRRQGPPGASQVPIAPKPLPTIAIGVVGGFIVGMTSVGSGSLIIVMLMLLYPRLSGSRLVGTDLAQAIPLVGAAALGHFLFGHVSFGLTASLIAGSVPGVCLGAYGSARAPDRVIRPLLVLVLAASALKLLGASNALVGVVVGGLATLGIAWAISEGRIEARLASPAVDAESAAQAGGE